MGLFRNKLFGSRLYKSLLFNDIIASIVLLLDPRFTLTPRKRSFISYFARAFKVAPRSRSFVGIPMSRSFLVVNNGRSFKAKPRTRGFTVFPTARQFTIEGSTPIMNFKSAKDPGETRLITLMFTGDLVSGETLTGTPTVVVVDLVTGETITGMAANTPVISQNGTGVSFLLSGGILGQSYSLTATCSTSTGEVISEGAILSIQLAAFMN